MAWTSMLLLGMLAIMASWPLTQADVYPHVLLALFHGGNKSSGRTPCLAGGPNTMGQPGRKILTENP
jgi:hypothetical protein